MFVKICGITNREDAQAAVDSGANALGFIFHPPSSRYVRPEQIAGWIDAIPRNIWRVGVFVNRPTAEIERVARESALDVVQLHGQESPSEVPAGLRVWKAFRIAGEIPPEVNLFPAEAALLDGTGSGSTFDWSLTRRVQRNFVLAGGVSEDNVTAAIEQINPWGIDVCSSLELSPGKKDHVRMRRFLKACQPSLSIVN